MQSALTIENEKLLLATFQAPTVIPQPFSRAKSEQEPTQSKQTTRAAVIKREYDQKLEQTRQMAQRQMQDDEQREFKRFRDQKLKLLQGNETIVRSVDAILLTQAQERQLAKEKHFVDYEMNTFIPIHGRIQEVVTQGFPQRQTLRHSEHERFARYSKKKGMSLENINENEYDPNALPKLTVPCKICDPVERANQYKKTEDRIVERIEKLTGKKETQFVGHNRSAAELQQGVTSDKSPVAGREVIDVTKWGDITTVMVVPGVGRAPRPYEPIVAPYALDE